jgi:lysozyme
MRFLKMVEKTYHQKPLIYTFANFYDHYLSGVVDDYKLMIAQYTKREPLLADGKDICMWQYTGKGHINGVNTYVDKSRFMGRHSLREIRFHH